MAIGLSGLDMEYKWQKNKRMGNGEHLTRLFCNCGCQFHSLLDFAARLAPAILAMTDVSCHPCACMQFSRENDG